MSQLESAATNRETAQEDLSGPPAANRHRLPDERVGLTHHFSIAGHEGYLTIGLYPNGQPGEIFIRMAKEGSTIAGLMECFGTVVSVSLQHGVPLKVLCDKLSHTRFEPSAGPAMRNLVMRSRSWTISFAGWHCDSCQASSYRFSHSRPRLSYAKAARSQTRLLPAFRNFCTTAMRLEMRRSASPVGH
jgi:hypothetical protein